MKKATKFKNLNYSVSSQSKWTFDIPPIKEFVNQEVKIQAGLHYQTWRN